MAGRSFALLICGGLSGNLYEQYGDYNVVFTTFFRRALPIDIDFKLDSYDVVHKMQYPSDDAIDAYDGIVLTGSAASAYENVDWINKLIGYVAHIADVKPQIKIIGICFGHQIVARALGGECVPNNGKWEVGPTPMDLTDIGKEIFGVETLNIQQMHRDHVPSVPPTFHLLGSTPVSLNQGMVRFEKDAVNHDLSNIHIFTVQGHPEYHEGIVSGLVELRSRNGIIDAETAQDAERRKNWRNDGVGILGKAIWGIFGVAA